MCAGRTELMYITREADRPGNRGNYPAEELTTARALCGACPCRFPCLEHALSTVELFGVWGGTTPAERKVMLRERGG